jgi:uncharacterized protein (TIGR04255 family)
MLMTSGPIEADEIFTYPTVKQVIFQIKFANLFFLESKIGEFQLKVMEEFPDSELGFTRQLFFMNLGPNQKPEDMLKDKQDNVRKIWTFNSPKKYKMNLMSDSLDITSEYHKTYNNPASDTKFRDIIELAIKSFLETTTIPVVKRVGLRYIDQCPIKSKDNETFREYFNTTLPIDTFNLENSDSMTFDVLTKRDGFDFHYREMLFRDEQQKYSLIMDFDGSAQNVRAENILTRTDDIYKLISKEWKSRIKEPLKQYMRTGELR